MKRHVCATREWRCMVPKRRSFLLLSLFLLPIFASRVESQDAFRDLHLGFAECAPAVFFPLQAGTSMRISEITYAKTGMLSSFKEEISHAGRRPMMLTVTLDLNKWTGRCTSLEYSVAMGGRVQTSPKYDAFDERKLTRTVAFSPEENVGIIVGGGPLEHDLTTQLGYDEKGRRHIRQQVFGSGGTMYEVSFSDYVWMGPPTGKMGGFAARITTVAK